MKDLRDLKDLTIHDVQPISDGQSRCHFGDFSFSCETGTEFEDLSFRYQANLRFDFCLSQCLTPFTRRSAFDSPPPSEYGTCTGVPRS